MYRNDCTERCGLGIAFLFFSFKHVDCNVKMAKCFILIYLFTQCFMSLLVPNQLYCDR